MEELKKLLADLNRAFEEYKKINDQRLAEIKNAGSSNSMTEQKLAKAEADIDRLSKERETLLAEFNGVKTALNRPGMGGEGSKTADESKAKAVKEAYNLYMRAGKEAMSPEQVKLLSTDDNPNGGYLVRPELSNLIVKKVFESTPMRELASSVTIGSNQLDILSDLDEAGSGWVGEQGTRSETTTPALKQISLPVFELYAEPKATQRMLDDGLFDMEMWLAGKVADKFGRDEATAFVSGIGVAKPMGFLSYPSGTSFGQIEQKVSGSAALLTADGMFDLQNSLKEPYQANATWLLQRITVASLRKLKDGTGRYIWQPGLTDSAPASILGRPYRMASDMPAEGAGNLAIAYGDFKQGYLIVDRVGIRTLRDPFSSKPYVLFYTTKRVGGGVVNFESIKIGKCST